MTTSKIFPGRLAELNWFLPVLTGLIGLIGVVMIYSTSDGVWDLGAHEHFIRLVIGFGVMIAIALTHFRLWFAVAYPAYIFALLLLVGVEVAGVTVNSSQRWLDLGITRIQPSELMKLAVILALARFYHDLPMDRVSRPSGILGASLIILVPLVLVLRQPDLGTAVLLGATGAIVMFVAGIKWRVLITAFVVAGISLPIVYQYGLKDYQKERVQTFFNPEHDPTDAGYQIIQSKIALGSGGVSGKGFQEGTQASLKYVPEIQTDFIFTAIGEELGLIGGLTTMALFELVILVCFWLTSQCRTIFARLVVIGITATFGFCTFINLAMVMGLAPVVGVPLPLVSRGGTVMLTVLAGFGMILSAHLYRNRELPRGAGLLF